MKKIFLLVLLFISFNVLYSQEKVLTNNGVYKTIDEILGNRALDPADFSGGKFIQESNGAFVPVSIDSSILNITIDKYIGKYLYGTDSGFVPVSKSDILGYTRYVALLTQSSTTAPTATVLENSTGATFTYSYENAGEYVITCNLPLFESGVFFQTIILQDTTLICLQALDEYTAVISIFPVSNDKLSATPFEIIFY